MALYISKWQLIGANHRHRITEMSTAHANEQTVQWCSIQTHHHPSSQLRLHPAAQSAVPTNSHSQWRRNLRHGKTFWWKRKSRNHSSSITYCVSVQAHSLRHVTQLHTHTNDTYYHGGSTSNQTDKNYKISTVYNVQLHKHDDPITRR